MVQRRAFVQRLLGLPALRDVGDGRAAEEAPLPLIVVQHALHHHGDRCAALPGQAQFRGDTLLRKSLQVLAELSHVLPCDVQVKRHAHQPRPLDTEHAGGGEVDIPDQARVIHRHVAHRGEIVEVGIPVARELHDLLRLAQLAVLRLQLDLVNLQLMEQSFMLEGNLAGRRALFQRPDALDQLRLRHRHMLLHRAFIPSPPPSSAESTASFCRRLP